MPNWKKVITSGSNASLGTLYVAGTISGPNANISIGSTGVALGATVTNLPGMGTITAASFVGPLTGNASTATTATTATNATNVNTGLVTTNATHYIPFVPDNNLSPATETLGTVGSLTYNPSTGQFGATKIVATSITGSLQGSISGTAATASLSLSAAPFSVTAGAILTAGSSDSGKVLIGTTASGASWAGLTAGSGISITSGSGAITITSTAGGSGTVTSVSTAGTVSGITLTGGPITGAGTITLGGSISGLTNSNLSGTAGITNANLANSAITIAGTSTSLGGSITRAQILAGSGIFSGSAQITGLTNSNLSGTAGITNANLANSAVTVGSTSISLGSSATTIAGLSSVTSTTFVGALTGNASTATSATSATTATSSSFATTANNANLVNIATQDTTPVTYNVTFTGGASGYNSLNVDATTLTYNPSTTTLTTGTFSGALSGNASTATTATNATNTAITDTTTGAGPYYLTFVSSTSGNQAQRVDSSGLTYNATSNAVTASWFKGDLVGNASTATQVRVIAAGGKFDIGGSALGAAGSSSELYTDPALFTYDATLAQLYISDTGGNKMFHGVDAAAGYGYVQSQAVSGQYVIGSNTIAFYDGGLGAYQGQFVGGNFDAALDITCGGTKFFDIPHQTKQGWGLKHGAIEGPESGVYFRGKLNGSDKIELPEYWQWLVREDTITVSLTPVGQYQTLYVKDIKDNKVYIGSDNDYVNCHYVVYGERADVEKWDAEYESYSRGEK